MFDEHGVRLEDKESLLTQPIDPRFPEAKNVTVLKEMVIFITPPQQNTELLLSRGWRLRPHLPTFRPNFQATNKTVS